VTSDRDLTFRRSSTSRLAFDDAKETTTSLATVTTAHEERLEEWPSFVGETFAKLYRPQDADRALEPDEVIPWARKAHDILERQGAWPELRVAAQAHRSIAAEAAATLAAVVADEIAVSKLTKNEEQATSPKDYERRIRSLQAMKEALEEEGDDEGAKACDQAMADAWNNRRTAAGRRSFVEGKLNENSGAKLAGVVAKVAKEAQEKASALDLVRGWGLGGGASGDDDDVDPELLKMLMSDVNLRRILERVGRIRAAAAAKGATKVGSGRTDVVGIVTGSDPRRLVPTEIARLGHPTLKLDLYRRLYDENALVWEMRGEEKADRGDMLIMCDRSGSMAGEPMVWMRAVAACALLQAVEAKRRAVLMLFDDDAVTVVVDPKTAKNDLVAALRVLSESSQGGTNINGALAFGSTLIDPSRGTMDTLIITDGIFPAPPKECTDAVRRDGARVHLVMIGSASGGTTTHKSWVDEAHGFANLSDDAGADVLSGLSGEKKNATTTSAPAAAHP
jgi:uncharacterized protein with von Willebrand factor type A (vWA) domain